MSELLKTFDSYQDFERDAFFTLSYDTLPSELCFETSLSGTKANINKVVSVLQLKENGFDLIFKKWDWQDSYDADPSKDFPFELLFKGTSNKLIIWVSLQNDTLYTEFLYDCQDQNLEKWVILTNQKLRQNFGLSEEPTFKVLTKGGSGFSSEEVRTQETSFDIKWHYNDDFQPVNDRILESIDDKQSGLILLHGVPGTGKTTYIKSLISSHSEKNFIFVQNEFVNHLLEPDFISFLLKQRNSILIIEDAEKVITSRDQRKEESVVSTILQLTDGLFSDYLNIKTICTFNSHLSQIDTALLRKGRMIAMYEFKQLELDKANKLLTKMKLEPSDKELTLADIFNYQAESYSNIEKRKIGFMA